MTSRPHDALFRIAFEDPTHAAAELAHVLPPGLATRIDWSSLQREPGTFVDPTLADSESDLLFRARMDDVDTLVYLLFEHQSTVDPSMPLRLLGYMHAIWSRQRRARPDVGLCPIVPVVLSHAPEGWPAKPCFADLFEDGARNAAHLRRFLPTFEIVVDDLAAESVHRLRGRALAAFPKVALWLLRDARAVEPVVDGIRGWLAELRELAHDPRAADLWLALLAYLDHVFTEVQFRAFRDTLLTELPETEEVIVTYGERLRQEGRQEGEREGLRRGKLSSLELLITRRFGELSPEVSARLATASAGQIERWLEEVLTSASVAELLGD